MSDGNTILLIIGMFIILLLSVVGNILTIVATYMFSNLRTRTNFLIVNLAVSDILVSLLAAPLRIVQSSGSLWSNKLDNCKFVIILTLFFCNASVLNLTLISIDRAVSIASPLTYSHSTRSVRFACEILTSWLLAVIISLLPFLGFGWNGSYADSTTTKTVDICRYLSILDKSYVLFVFASAVFIPFFIMIGCYMYILRTALAHLRRIHAMEKSIRRNLDGIEPTQTRNTENTLPLPHSTQNTLPLKTPRPQQSSYRSYLLMKELKAAKMIAMVVGFFVVCVMPIVLVDIAEIACGYPCTPSNLVTSAVYLSYLNPAVNILAYATISSDYRKAYKKILLHFLCCKRKHF